MYLIVVSICVFKKQMFTFPTNKAELLYTHTSAQPFTSVEGFYFVQAFLLVLNAYVLQLIYRSSVTSLIPLIG